VLRHRFSWKRLSMAAALAYAVDRADARIIFETRPGAYNDESLIEFLRALHDELAGAKVTLIWDGLPSHRSRKMQAFIRSQRRWLVVERLPGYAPDLNPVEALWGNVKGTELANLCADTIDEPATAASEGINRVRADTTLAFAFLDRCGLAL
jgi:putative transposase